MEVDGRRRDVGEHGMKILVDVRDRCDGSWQTIYASRIGWRIVGRRGADDKQTIEACRLAATLRHIGASERFTFY